MSSVTGWPGVIVFSAVLAIMGSESFGACQVHPQTSFSDVIPIGPEYLEIARNNRTIGVERFVHLPAPPGLDSPQLCTELEKLHLLSFSWPDRAEEILCQANVECFRIGKFSFGDLEHYPYTNLLLRMALRHLDPILLKLKISFDRPRPSFLDKNIVAKLPIPAHPSYPSGHAAQSTLIALILSDLDPDNERDYMLDAERVGVNREIAGLHFASDTQAGKLLAAQFLTWLRSERWYSDLTARAEQEWCSDCLPLLTPTTKEGRPVD